MNQQNKNIVLISIDAFGADKLWELDDVSLPNFRFLEKKGISFKKLFSSTSSTTPSLTTVLSGIYPKDHGIISTYGEKLNDNIILLQDVLKQNGYATSASVGGPLMEKTGVSRGFTKYYYHNPWYKVRFLRWSYGIKRTKRNHRLTEKEFNKAIANTNPFFHWTHLFDLHNRWRINDKNSTENPYKVAMKSLDKRLGRYLKKINFDNTLVILTADHGHHVEAIDGTFPNFDYEEAHGFNISDTLTNVPMIIIAPNMENRNIIINDQISTRSIFSTVLDFAKIKNPLKNPAKSLAPYLYTKETIKNEEKPVYIEACGSILRRQGKKFLHGIRYNNFKYVIPKDNNKAKAELFNLEKDPKERINIYHLEIEIAKKMHAILLKESQTIIK